jgi:hypothetical protein
VIALLQRHDARPDIDHDARALMAEDHREQAFGIAARARELVGMANARRLDLDQHLAELRPFEVDFLDLEVLAGLEADCRLCLHARPPGNQGAKPRAGEATMLPESLREAKSRTSTRARCHPERSEGPFLWPQRSLAALGMTVMLLAA